MKKTTRKLTLPRETVRHLIDLEEIRGGVVSIVTNEARETCHTCNTCPQWGC